MKISAKALFFSSVFSLFIFLIPVTSFGQAAKKAESPKKQTTKASVVSTWKIDPAHSSAEFKVRHLSISKVAGRFTDVQGEVTTDENDLTKTKVSVEIGVASITTGVEKRDNHLKSPDFFDAAKYPKIKFVSTKVYQGKDQNWLMDGDLTMKDVTKPVTLTLEGPSKPVKGPSGKLTSGVSGTTSINRKDFGLMWNNAVEGVSVVADTVNIEVNVELVRK